VTLTFFALLLLSLDFQNLVSNWRGWVLETDAERSDDFTIMVALYGDPRYFANREHLRPRQANVLLCLDVSDPRMARYAREAEADGWRVFETRCEHLPPGPSELCLKAMESGLVTTTYAVRLDGDTYAPLDLGHAIAAAERDGADVCSVKVLASNTSRVVEALQGVEYRMSMLSRHYRPWTTSGACIIGRTEAFRYVLERHSHWFPGEDMETGRIAAHHRMRVRHVDFEVYTDVPNTWRSLFRQRRMWWAGNFRHMFVNFDRNMRMPLWTLYYVFLVYVLAEGKARHLAGTSLRTLPFLLLVYTGISLAANWKVRSRWMIAYPYYSLLQTTVMPLFGVAAYVRIAWKRRTLGRYRIGMRRPRPYEALARIDAGAP
jgi:cellulose synthase/poly-beta-1,6-N-acetylglucosamine synthase-like glycosyltransferase